MHNIPLSGWMICILSLTHTPTHASVEMIYIHNRHKQTNKNNCNSVVYRFLFEQSTAFHTWPPDPLIGCRPRTSPHHCRPRCTSARIGCNRTPSHRPPSGCCCCCCRHRKPELRSLTVALPPVRPDYCTPERFAAARHRWSMLPSTADGKRSKPLSNCRCCVGIRNE